MGLILALDLGTSTIKAGLVDEAGRLAQVAAREYMLDTPAPGWSQVSDQTVWRCVRECVHEVVAAAGARAGEIQAVGFSSSGHTFVCRDEAGEALYPFMTWLDQRGTAEAGMLLERFGLEEIYAHTGYPSKAPYCPAALLLWLRRNEPEMFRRVRHVHVVHDDVVWRLTGRAVTDHVLAGTTACFDLRRGRWWPEMLELVGLDESVLPEVVRAGTEAGRLRKDVAAELGLAPGLPVVVGTNDQLAGALGVGNCRPGIISETTGTAMALVTVIESPLDRLADGLPWWGNPLASYFSSLAIAPTAASVLKWYKDKFAPDESYDRLMAHAESVAIGCDGLTVIPHFSGTGPPHNQAAVRGHVAGLGFHHGKAHFARGIVEGVSFAFAELVEIIRSVSADLVSIRSMGGAAKSDFWLQMKADIVGLRVERAASAECALVGAAAMAASCIGWFASVPEASAAFYRPAHVFEPRDEYRAPYAEAYARYRHILEMILADDARGA